MTRSFTGIVKQASGNVLRLLLLGYGLSSGAWAVPVPPNVAVGGHIPGVQNEEQVWICPNDTNIVLTNHRDFRLGYRQIGIGRSTDGGATWSDSLISTAYQKLHLQSDPAMTIRSDGSVLIAHLDYATSGGGTLDSSFISILKSGDCGLTWSGPYTIEDTIGKYLEDKDFITSDRTGGPYDGNTYVAWARVTPGMQRIMFARSTDGGVSWDDTVVVGPPISLFCFGLVASGDFAQPLVGKDGAVYVFWRGIDVDPPPSCTLWYTLRLNKSTDGGVTWHGGRQLRRVGGGGNVDGSVATNTEPITDADLTNGPHSGNLYLQFMDLRSGASDQDIWFQRSSDTSHTWTEPMRVNDDPIGPNVDQFHNWMACNNQGVLVSVWYDQRTDPAHSKFDVFAAYSFDGGETWTSNHRVSSVSIDPSLLALNDLEVGGGGHRPSMQGQAIPAAPQAGVLGEYIGVSCVEDKIVAAWTDTRSGDQDVWSAHWHLPLTDPRLLTDSGAALACSDSLHWATAWKEWEDRYFIQISTSAVFAPDSVVWQDFLPSSSLPLTPVIPSGTLYWRLKAYRAPGGVRVDSTGYSLARSFQFSNCGCTCECTGDPTCDSLGNILDIVNIIDVAFNGVVASTDPGTACPYQPVDVNCSGAADILDVVIMIDVVIRKSASPTQLCHPCR